LFRLKCCEFLQISFFHSVCHCENKMLSFGSENKTSKKDPSVFLSLFASLCIKRIKLCVCFFYDVNFVHRGHISIFATHNRKWQRVLNFTSSRYSSTFGQCVPQVFSWKQLELIVMFVWTLCDRIESCHPNKKSFIGTNIQF